MRKIKQTNKQKQQKKQKQIKKDIRKEINKNIKEEVVDEIIDQEKHIYQVIFDYAIENQWYGNCIPISIILLENNASLIITAAMVQLLTRRLKIRK